MNDAAAQVDEAYLHDGDFFRPHRQIEHREEEYESCGFDVLRRMQQDHFWYRGRHRFLLRALQRELRRGRSSAFACRAVDVGGGCGGWLRYLADHWRGRFTELALADSSLKALAYARDVVPPGTPLYQCDLLHLGWSQRWDVIFLLDVLEHIPDDAAALSSIWQALVPGGLLVVTTPALRCFWTWNDEAARHQRRYSRADFRRLAQQCGFELLDARYFMFFLSPVMMVVRWLARLRASNRQLSAAELAAMVERTHRLPAAPINRLLSAVCALETPLGHYFRFPWGTSVLALLRKA